MSFGQCLGAVAPFYNLILSVIVLFFFLQLFKVSKKWDIVKPWVLLFTAFVIYVLEEILTILRSNGVLQTPRVWNGFFEMAMIALFIYVLLSELERFHHRDTHGKR